MPEPETLHVAACTAIAFAAGWIDAMAGGGGILTVPAIASFGYPMSVVGGTNKVVGTSGSATATITFLREGKVEKRTAAIGFVAAAGGAVLGALGLARLGEADERLASLVFGVLLVAVAIHMFLRKSLGGEDAWEGPTARNLAITAAAGVAIGFYDGFFGPGTGSFLVFVMVRFLRFDYVRGTGNAKCMNFGSNVASLATFIAKGLVVWPVAIPMACANAAGSWCGSRMAIARGARFVRWVFLAAAVAVAARLAYTLLG